ncbi:hypothetical protein FLK61_27405 [Paenalkalicoccus suaedae]|uniref:DUF3953 domain-containing protein n=1 Tax=Paenalkalicoccus suaedae TaxID=2592382 RepID=A0A859FAV9_9BACI|nr:hypothetical protein [Paenalkalicoccus suaedae]QKS70483.1 hypothetical protein FLK61_27405 [Paenalkalicoccus suaedae]
MMIIKVVGTIFAVLTIISAVLGLIQSTDTYTSYMLFFMSMAILSLGVESLLKNRRSIIGVASLLVGVFLLVVWVSEIL